MSPDRSKRICTEVRGRVRAQQREDAPRLSTYALHDDVAIDRAETDVVAPASGVNEAVCSGVKHRRHNQIVRALRRAARRSPAVGDDDAERVPKRSDWRS